MTREELDFLAEQIHRSIHAEEDAEDLSQLVESQEVELNGLRCRLEDTEALVRVQAKELEALREKLAAADDAVVDVRHDADNLYVVECYGMKAEVHGLCDGAEFTPVSIYFTEAGLTRELHDEIVREINNINKPVDPPTEQEVGF